MRIGSLFSGYGGLDQGVRAVLGGDVAWHSEFDANPSKILAHHHPDVPNLGDITAVDWTTVEPVDVITGGFPCQDVSHAGRRAGLGKGTHTGLWANMLQAIDTIRPSLVVAENVRGLLSARADSDMEPCSWCVGDGPTDHPMRALGAVLGDLADIGYDAAWTGLRAADVGAPHGRFRVFILAWPADDTDDWRRGEQHAFRRGVGSGRPSNITERSATDTQPLSLLPSPRTSDTNGPGIHGDGGMDLRTAVSLLPTPAVNDMGAGKTVEKWDEWTARMKAAHGNGNGHGASLSIEALRMLPTPRAGDGEKGGPNQRGSSGDFMLPSAVMHMNGDTHVRPAEGRPGEELRDLRGADDPQAVREAPRGQGRVPAPPLLLDVMREHEAGSGEVGAPLAGAEVPGGDVCDVRDDHRPARSPQGQEPGERRPGEPAHAVRVMSPAVALAGGPACPHGCGSACNGHSTAAWGQYEAAIRRWEVRLGRPAPDPTAPTGKGGSHRLSARFCEFLMGLPTGWVTDTPGLGRNAQLKALGNGVVPQQAAAALVHLLSIRQEAAA